MSDPYMAAGSDDGPAASSIPEQADPITAAKAEAARAWPTPANTPADLRMLRAAPPEVRIALYRKRHAIDPITTDAPRANYCRVDGILLQATARKVWHADWEVKDLAARAPIGYPSEVWR